MENNTILNGGLYLVDNKLYTIDGFGYYNKQRIVILKDPYDLDRNNLLLMPIKHFNNRIKIGDIKTYIETEQ